MGHELNACKTILAFEVTSLTHGQTEALAACEAASNIFGRRELPDGLLPSSSIRYHGEKLHEAIPTSVMHMERLRDGIPAFELFAEAGLCSSKSAARRLIQQGGAYVNEERVKEFDQAIGLAQMTEAGILLKAGKKKIHRILGLKEF
jgi:tyrosyl-tRNA synthetase